MSKIIVEYGASGAKVVELQTLLSKLGFDCGKIDGKYGEKTAAAVKTFQLTRTLPSDGTVDEITWTELNAALNDSVLDFIRWALTHVKSESIPSGATLLLPITDCGSEPWEYMFGTSGRFATKSLIEEKYINPYKGWGWPRDLYDKATAGWVEAKIKVCDCQGLLDAYCTQVLGVRTDLSAQSCFVRWCTDTGRIRDVSRKYVIGEAVFRANDYGTMKHIGWICGYDADGEPLVIEERGLSYGCVVTRLSGRGWTHRGLMTVRFVYETPEAGAYHAVCDGGSVNIRSGRGKEFGIVDVAHRGDLILALPAVNGWCRVAVAVEEEIICGYMSDKYVVREAC